MSATSQNALSRASSSYLRSAMHQPIQWHEWGAQAFAEAQRENKPILLDIGAVWCHWCHVMDRESYDDPEVAKIVNENFVAVKVDRDERPDIDSRYQAAVGALTGQGGWPLTGFLTADGKPFYGGTYFPPQDQYGRPSFKRVLLAIAQAYRDKKDEVLEQANTVTSAIERAETTSGETAKPASQLIEAVVDSALKMFDERNGGFGGAPKFPHPSGLDLLMEQYVATGNEQLQEAFVTTLEKMARGGVYDQLAGGFHRYSVDERWVVPHFEKMCYDNSELLKNYVHAWQATGNEFFAEVARDIVRWMDEWLSDRERGGFYASQDADYSMEDDGDYFTWTLDEARAVLTPEEAEVAAYRYDIGEIGEMHHNPAKNVLYIRAAIDEVARRLNIGVDRVNSLLLSVKNKMYAARLKRPTPFVDKTIYTGWNAMCVSAYLKAARVFGLNEALHFALRSLDRLLADGWVHGTTAATGSRAGKLRHVIAYSDTNAERRESDGVLDDYAFAAIACLDAYEATADMSYFRFGQKIVDAMIEGFYDSISGGFFDTPAVSAGTDKVALGILGTRRKPIQDSPTPAGNPLAAIALLRFHAYSGDAAYRERAEKTLEFFAAGSEKFGLFAATYALAVALYVRPQIQVVIIGSDTEADELCRAAQRGHSINKIVLRLRADAVVAQNLPHVLGETLPNLPSLQEKRSFAVICAGLTCQAPVYDPAEISRHLGTLGKRAA